MYLGPDLGKIYVTGVLFLNVLKRQGMALFIVESKLVFLYSVEGKYFNIILLRNI